MSMKPMVDRLEKDLGARAQVLRVDVRSDSGRGLAESLGLKFVPTFIIIDATGPRQR